MSSDKAVEAAMRACVPNGITDEEFLMLSSLRKGSEMSYKDVSIRILAAEVERLRECLDEAVTGLEWRVENDPETLDKSDYEKLDKWKQALGRGNDE